MFPLKKHDLEKLARETGFIQNSLEKMMRLIDALGQVARHPFLKNCFEINYLQRQPIVQVETKTCNLLQRQLVFPVLGFEELLAGKIIALLSRYTPRDLFDVYQATISPIHYSVETLRALVIFYGLISRASVVDLFKGTNSCVVPTVVLKIRRASNSAASAVSH